MKSRIHRIQIQGMSDAGAFGGMLHFSEKLCVVSGPNGYGKSTATKAIAWCLGLESLYGVQAGDASFIPTSQSIDLREQRRARVQSCVIELELRRPEDECFTIRRSLVGETMIAHVKQSRGKEELRSGNVKLGYGTMLYENAGLQRIIFDWLDIPVVELVRKQGGTSPLYFENLAPLFFIEQLEGWSEIQSRQIYKYGIAEVEEGAVELLLGLEAHLSGRKERQSARSFEDTSRMQISVLMARYQEAIRGHGWTDELRLPVAFSDLLSFSRTLSFVERVRSTFGFDINQERARLQARLVRLRDELTRGRQSENDVSSRSEASQQLVHAKKTRAILIERLAESRTQLHLLEHAYGDLELRKKSAADLLRLKEHGVGLFSETICPTCGQGVTPAALDLEDQSADDVRIGAEVIERELKTVSRNRSLLLAEIRLLSAELFRAENDLENSQRTVALMNQTAEPTREYFVKLSSDIVKLERDLERNISLWRQLTELEGELSRVLARTSSIDLAQESVLEAEQAQVRRFSSTFAEAILELRHNAVRPDERERVRLSDRYIPLLGDQKLHLLGSASDRARLVLAYVWALARVGAHHHPGFLVLDEPLQQNPDHEHISSLLKFFGERCMDEDAGQILVFTTLTPNHVNILREYGVNVVVLEDEHLLLPVDSARGAS